MAASTVTFTDAEVLSLHHRADEAGRAAADAARPTPMIVGTPRNMLASLTGGDDGGLDPDKPQYFVSEGVCGFAWVHVLDGRSSFARRWKRLVPRVSNHYRGGLQLWVSAFGQSMQRKEAYAQAYAEVLREAGVRAFAGSRMD